MISIIICSVNPLFLQQLKENISSSIGCSYEVIAIDNRKNKKGICEVYNLAASRAKYDTLCFMHEDVLLHSYSWGTILLKILSETTIGLVGISGTIYKSHYPAIWSACDQSLYRTHSIQHFKNSYTPITTKNNPNQEICSEVAVLDGVFMATRKDVFQEFNFDEKLFLGFHAYDLDYSLQIGSKYKLVVTYEILLEHFSEGSLTKEWLRDYLLLHKKWEAALPKQVKSVAPHLQRRSDYLSCQSVLQQVIQNNSGKSRALHYFSILITRFIYYNGAKYSKSVLKYLFTSQR